MFVIGLLCRCFRHRSVNSRHQNWICLISMNILHLRKPDLHSWPTNVSNSQHLWMLFDACLLFVNPLWMWYILWSCCFSQMSQGSIWAVDLPVSPLLSTQPCLFVPARLVSHARGHTSRQSFPSLSDSKDAFWTGTVMFCRTRVYPMQQWQTYSPTSVD